MLLGGSALWHPLPPPLAWPLAARLDPPLPGCCMRPSDTLPPSPMPGLPGAWAPWSAPPLGPLHGPVPGAGPGRASSSTLHPGVLRGQLCSLQAGPPQPRAWGGGGRVPGGEQRRREKAAGRGWRRGEGRGRGGEQGGRNPPPGCTQHFAPTSGREPRGGETPLSVYCCRKVLLFVFRLACLLFKGKRSL